MAAPAESGYGLGANEPKTVSIDEVDRQIPKVATGLSEEEAVGVDGQNGSEAAAAAEGGEGDAHGEEKVAKKPRLEKAENGATEGPDESEHGVESLGGAVAKEDAEHHNGNGVAKAEDRNGEGDEEEQNDDDDDDEGDVVGAEEEEGTDGAGATGKEEGGDGGLRTLLQEGESKKGSVVKQNVDASHVLNGAK